MGVLASLIKSITQTMANYGLGSASMFGAYQPKEPKL